MTPILAGAICPDPAPYPAAVSSVMVTVTEAPSPALLARWSRLVTGSPAGDVAQLPGWARLRGTVGFTARYVFVHAGPDGALLGGAQVLERTLPLIGRIGYVPYGPVLAEGIAESAAVRTAICAALDELGRDRLRMLFVQPPTGVDGVSEELLSRGFRFSRAGIAPAQTLRLDLSQDLAALRGGLSKRLRTWTNRWAARGVTVRLGTEADVPVLAELVARSGEHQGFAAVTGDYLDALLKFLSDGGAAGADGHAVLFVGELADGDDGPSRPVAAALYTRCGDTLTLRFAGMDRDDAAARLNVPAAIYWHAIGWAKRAGLRWFDFGGISAESAAVLAAGEPRQALRGVDRFKASFGGTLVCHPPAVELIAHPVLRAGYDLLARSALGQRLVELAKAVLRTGRGWRSAR